MSKIPEEVIADWAKKKKHIRDRINRINKRLKKYEKQKKHFELRLRLVKEYESKQTHVGDSSSNGTKEGTG
jgi:hypothetical protein